MGNENGNPDRSSCVLIFSIMNLGITAEGQGIYPSWKATAVHLPNGFAATLKLQ